MPASRDISLTGNLTRARTPRTLVIFPGALGDFICFIPALHVLSRDACGGSSVELMAKAELARFAENRLPVTRGHSIDRLEVASLFDPAGPSAAARRFFGEFDRVYSFFASADGDFRRALAAATGGRVSFHPFRPEGEGHVAWGYLRELGSENDCALVTNLRLLPQDLSAAQAIIRNLPGAGARRLALVFPGSGSPRKNWPPERFVALCLRLTAQGRIFPLAVLGPAESSLKARFREAGISVVTDLELETVAGLARMAHAFVANDSGVAHLASAVGVPGVVLFGPTDPRRWRPLGSSIEVIHRPCLAQIGLEEVEAALLQVLAL